MNSKIIKAAVIYYYRFKRRHLYFCTEYNNEADVLCSNGVGRFDEIEIKISWSDFLADFKKVKHEEYRTGKLNYGGRNLTPTYFWFAAPIELAKRIHIYILEHKLPYGVYLYDEKDKCVNVLHTAKKLNAGKCDLELRGILARMGSELAWKLKRDNLKILEQTNNKEYK